jgi:hypothetical protein
MLLKKIQFIFIGFIFLSAIKGQRPSYFNSSLQGGTNQFPFNNFSHARQVFMVLSCRYPGHAAPISSDHTCLPELLQHDEVGEYDKRNARGAKFRRTGG